VVRVWDAANAIELHRFQAGDRSVESLGLSPDGRRIASGSRGIIRVWNLESGTAIRTINCFANPHKMESGRLVMSDKVESLRFTPDGQQIIGESPHERCVWHADTGSVSSDALQLAWRGTRHGLEMMAGSNGADQPFVWFPIYEFQGLSSDLSGRICATNINEYLCLFMIEGAVPPDSAVPSVM
jgi:WD40 repeat protein